MSFPSKTTYFYASYCLVPLVSALIYLICSTIPPMHSENDQYTTMSSFHQLTAARVREEHSPSRAARVKMKEARKKAGDDDFSRLLCHEYSLCACSMHARTRMRTHAHANRKLKTVLPVMDCPRVHERSVSADLKRAGSGDEIRQKLPNFRDNLKKK